MKRITLLIPILVTSVVFLGFLTAADAQRRRRPGYRNAPVMQSQLTGTYRLNPSNSDNPRDIAARAAQNLPSDMQQSRTGSPGFQAARTGCVSDRSPR